MALGLLATAAPSASAADGQSGDGQLRVTIGQPGARANALASPAANASCAVNRITVNRFSECEWVTVHLDVVKVINGRPVIEGTADFSVKHQMTLKTNSANWSEKFTISKAATTGQGNGVAVKFSATSGQGRLQPRQRLLRLRRLPVRQLLREHPGPAGPDAPFPKRLPG
ncbi:hypothetical protein ACFVW1_45600 [Streptomyces olivochromogenes]|uniref:hypothetical protein n=1 Tax=Streptomyces olivochromogenes TaxID=1963 RepID=UPI0036D9132E